MFSKHRLHLIWIVASLTSGALFAQSEHIVLPQKNWSDSVTVTMTGEPTYFHRHRLEVEDVPWERQAIYQSSWAGNLGLRIAGLTNGVYRVHLEYTEMDMNAPWIRYFDILINGELVAKEVNIFEQVGNRRVLSFDFPATPKEGVITFEQHKSVPEADFPSFTLLQVYDENGDLVAERSAYEMRPADWDLRGYLDKIYFGPIKNDHTIPPWEGSYNIRANHPEKLTAADVLGPDGIAYPNWTQVGLPDGIPDLENTLDGTDFGMVAGDELDDSAALQSAIDALQAIGGGVLYIPAGRYYIDRPVVVQGDNMVLRGAGMDRTQLISRFSMKGLAPEFHDISPADPLGPNGFYYVWLDPDGLTGVDIHADGKLVNHISRPGLWETQILFRYRASELLEIAGPGKTNLQVTASYRDGSTRTASQSLLLTEEESVAPRPYGVLSVITFRGRGAESEQIPLSRTAERGDMSLELAPGHGIKAGDRIFLRAPVTEEWKRMHRDDHRGGLYRSNMYDVVSVKGNRIELPEALRIEFPVGPATVSRLIPQLHCGIEDLSIEQAVMTKVHTIVFEYNWESWVRGIKVLRTGNKSLYMPHSKRCEVRDSIFDRVWWNGGGAAYIGWEHSFDCLMEGITSIDMRHAPVVQWSTAGCVIRNSVFQNSDAQWHAGWTQENLYEGLIVESSQDGGSYGNGMWASGPEDTGHGPNGPRNVIYNCNVSSSKCGIWMGGMNENWLIMYNRFVVGRGPAVLAKAASFDHIIEGNVFVMMEPYPAAIYLASADCTGIELVNNRFFGPVDQLVGGAVRPAVEWDNRVLDSGNINRPQPVVRSIFDWQQANKSEIAVEQARRAATRGR